MKPELRKIKGVARQGKEVAWHGSQASSNRHHLQYPIDHHVGPRPARTILRMARERLVGPKCAEFCDEVGELLRPGHCQNFFYCNTDQAKCRS